MTRPVLHNIDEIAIVEHRARHGYKVTIGQGSNGDSFVEITGLKREREAWSPTSFGFRLPSKLLRKFAQAFTDAADLIDARRAAGGGQ